MASFSTLEALNTLTTSIPVWNGRLDDLNGQIANRQAELARLTDERPPTRSLKNKGSTESLRPKDGDENPFLVDDVDRVDEKEANPFDSPKSGQNGFATNPRPGSRTAPRTAATALELTPPPKAYSNPPRPSPGALNRQSSQPTPTTQRLTPAMLRKRKTDSLVSEESVAPKYRTRSMIIVYYDSAVQTAFEELVKFVSGSRNAMRKGKMAAKMAEMRRAAEIDLGGDDEDDDDVDGMRGDLTNLSGGFMAQKKVAVAKDEKVPIASTEATELEAVPTLRFVSTRKMGPSRDQVTRDPPVVGTSSLGLLKGFRRSNLGGDPDIFDEIDKGLEWCQSQCEHAAHQFLRDGECSTEIENIKRRLEEVKETAQKEVEKIKVEEATAGPTRPPRQGTPDEGKSRELRAVHMRREFGKVKEVQPDAMEVDDEGLDDMEPPVLIYKKARDIGI